MVKYGVLYLYLLSIENSAPRDCSHLCWMTLTPLKECILCSGDMIRSSNILNTVCEAPGSELVLLSLDTGWDEVVGKQGRCDPCLHDGGGVLSRLRFSYFTVSFENYRAEGRGATYKERKR